MDNQLKNIITSMLSEGVSADEFNDFAVTFGINQHPIAVTILHHLMLRETSNTPHLNASWSEDDAEALLQMFQSNETNSEVMDDDSSQPELEMTETDQFEPWSPGFQKIALEHEDDQFEPWSPGFQNIALEYQDTISASLACLRDGEFRLY